MSFEKVMLLLVGVLTMIIPQLKKADSVVGVKETSEALRGVNEISLFLVQRFKDGLGFDDATAMWEKLKDDEAFKLKVKQGYEGYKLIPAEFKDLDAGEGLELASVQLEYVPKFVNEFKKNV